MKYLEEKTSNVSILIENQFPNFVQETNDKFLSFVSSYYESQEGKYQPLDIASNLVDYYNISYYSPSKLVESTNLDETNNLSKTATTITVESTVGFPGTNGYIQIDNEIIFYRSKNKTQFLECERGTTALVLQKIPKSNLFLTTSDPAEHLNSSAVKNIAYDYANEFFSRIKSELSPLIPEGVDESLNLSSFIKNIKSFYSAKGSLNSHKILFKILFNDRKFNIKLKSRGSGAKLKINNSRGYILGDGIQIVSGGSGYDNRKEGGVLINPPVVDIFGSGTGVIDQITKKRTNKTAIVVVDDINSDGVITSVKVEDAGESYRGPITSRIRPKNFSEDEVVKNISGTGYGRVEYYDAFTDELILYDVVGYFLPNEEIYSNSGEKARAFISQSYISPSVSRNGLEIIGENQNIEFPKEYTFKTSNSTSSTKKIIKCKLIDGYFLKDDRLPNVISLIQDSDKIFGVPGVTIEVDNNISLSENIYEFDVTTNTDINNIFLPSSTLITKDVSGITSSTSNFVLTVDDASRFPVTNGVISIKGSEIFYRYRSVNQFFDCQYSGTSTLDFSVKDEVISVARLRYDKKWISSVNISVGEYVFYEENLYIAKNSGISGSIAPVHTSGSKYDGSIVGSNPVLWEYIGKNRLDHTLYIDYKDPTIINPRFQLLGMPGKIIIESGGSLHSYSNYSFARFDSPNVDVYNFTTSEISDRLSVVLGTNYNTTRNSVIEDSNHSTLEVSNIQNLPSYQSLTGFTSQYDFEDYIYVAGSGIPRWWDDIVDLNTTLTTSDLKKVSFTNQRLITRWKKSSLISDTQAIGVGRSNKKLIGLNIDAIQTNSYKGNTISYGYIEKFYIGDGGDYPVTYTEDSNGYGVSVDLNGLPKFVLSDGTSVSNANKLVRISSSIKSIDFNKLASVWSTNENLIKFSSKPDITVINNNPFIRLEFLNFNSINTTTQEITSTNHNLETATKVRFNSEYQLFANLIDGEEYYVRKIDNDKFTLHKTKSESLLNSNKISLGYISITNPKYTLISEQLNPDNFVDAKLELSYKNGVIDNIIVRESGSGYIELPTIRISGGGKISNNDIWYVDLPFSLNGDRIVECSGPLVSYFNYYKDNDTELEVATSITEGFSEIQKTYDIAPSVTINFGSGAKAVAYTENGVITSLSLVDQGSGYTLPPKVIVTGSGKNAVITSTIENGKVKEFTIVNGGSGYVLSPRIDIISSENKKAIVSSKLKEWTFNLVRQLKKLGRIDSYGGYVYDTSDSVPTSSTINPKKFKFIDYKNDFPKDLDEKQYYLIQNSDKLLAKYILEKSPESVIVAVEAALGKTRNNFTDEEILTNFVLHSPAIMVSYDGVPLYGGRYILKERNKNIITDITNVNYASQFTEAKSRYKLRYIEHSTQVSGSIALTVGGSTKYVTLDRHGGPSISEYPIGTFIEDYEFVEGDDNDLDKHNGRFSITPEFPQGRYCYFSTKKSYDDITNALVESSVVNNNSIGFNGFPYFIGDTFASEYDDYMNNRCRRNDKIPSAFTRSFEKDVDPIITNGVTLFPGLKHNDEYPQEDIDLIKTVAKSTAISPGSVDSIIIESSGDNYQVGDRLVVDNNLTSGSGFSAIVSKVGGKTITKITPSSDFKEVVFTTDKNHGLAVNDFVYFEYTNPDKNIEINLPDNHLGSAESTNRVIPLSSVSVDVNSPLNLDVYKNIEFYDINLNFKYTYLINLPLNAEFKLTYDIEKTNEFFTLEESPTNTVVLNCLNIPNRLYLHVGNRIYQINKTRDYYGIQKIVKTTDKTFTIKFIESVSGYETVNISYSAKSYGAVGPIEDISITNPGAGYKKLPTVTKIIKKGTEDTDAGDGNALIQTDSNTIGKLKKISYNSIGGSFTSNRNVNFYLNIPATAKIINNFEIYDVEVVSGGSGYDNVVTLLVNGQEGLATLQATVSIGTITSVKVIDGGLNFSKIPSITVQSKNGSGASFKAKVRRKVIYPGTVLTGNVNSLLFPVGINASVQFFDSRSSTLEFNENVGQFKDGDNVYINGKVYGKILNIRRTKAYTKISPYAELQTDVSNISGRTSENLQKITDSNFYQDWSYSIASSRDTIEWKTEQTANTHPAGFKQFGKKLIERRKFFFKNPLDVFKSSVIFSTKISRTLDLSVKLSPCGKQRLFLFDVSGFTVGSYIIGATSGTVGKILEITEVSLIVEIYNDLSFLLDEIVVQVDSNFAYGKSSATFKSFNFWNGILQEPDESYEVSENPISYIPHYILDNSDEIVLYNFNTEYDKLDNQIIKSNQSSFSFTVDNSSYPVTPSIIDQFIISVGGIVQDPSSLSVSSNAVTLSGTFGHDSKVIAIRHTNLSKLTFTGSGTTYTINQTPTDNCQILIFRTGVFQTQLLTDFTVSGNQITFSEAIPAAEIFGWYFDGNINCQKIDASSINLNKIIKQMPCEKTKFMEKIESNAAKKPESIYEIRKETLDGTVLPISSTKVEGFDTRFTYTSPRYSESYVEVLDQIVFNGSTKTFNLIRNGENYTPKNGEESLVVYIDNDVLDHDQYSISGTTITFSQSHASSKNCTLLDFVSSYASNTNNENGTIIDRLNVVQNGTRSTFNLSDRGVPKYVNNVGDIFTIKNNKLLRPDSQTQSVNDNKITFVDSPSSTDDMNLVFFNRQLFPISTNNVMFDDPICFDGSRKTFPITVDGSVLSISLDLHFFVIRNGVMQKPGVDYTISNGIITFSEAPQSSEDGKIFAFYSYDGLNQNKRLNIGNYVNGIQSEFALTQNYERISLQNDYNLLVFRNGVHQEYSTDWAINNVSSGPSIVFTTAPQAPEPLFMINVTDSNFQFVSGLTQINDTTITKTNLGYNTSNFIIFVNGVKQSPHDGSYSITNPSGYEYIFTFSSNVSLINDKVSIYAYNGSGVGGHQCDSITVTNTSTLTYNLTEGGSPITNISNESGILVSVDGVVQEPGIAYTISGYGISNSITFTSNSILELGDKIDVITLGSNNDYIDYIDDNYNKTTQTINGVQIKPNKYKLAWTETNTDKYRSYNPSVGYDPDDILVLRNGVIQNPIEDYVIGAGYIEFTTNITENEDLYLLYVHSRDELSFTQSGSTSSTKTYILSSTITSSEEDSIIIYADGVPRFKRRGDFTVSGGNTITLEHADGYPPTNVFIIKYPNVVLIDDFEYCPNGTRTLFKLLINGGDYNASEVIENSDVLISKNGIIMDPGTEYALTTNKRQVNFTTAPDAGDVLFFVKMNGNKLKTLTNTTGNTYDLSESYPTSYDKEGLVIFSNNQWNFAEEGNFTWNDNNTITLSNSHTTGKLFAIKFFGVFNLLDKIHTPFNGSNTRFNLFDGEENFVPVGTADNDDIPDVTSILVIKNGNILEPGVDFTLSGDINSQIQFATAPISSDIISVRCVGSFDKLDTIANGSGTIFPLTKSGSDYYPNSHIDRPREIENQILVVKDGKAQSPLYDYYVYNNKVVFLSSVSGSRLVFLDFRGTSSDVRVFNRFNQVSVGDEVMISGESSPRKVSKVLSPTVLETESYNGNTPSNFTATTTYSNGIVTDFTMTNGGEYYENPVVIRTKGTGTSAKAVAYVKTLIGDNVVDSSTIDIQYPGRNIYRNQVAVATVYATTYKQQPIHKSTVKKATKLSSNINSTVETIPLSNTSGMSSNAPSVTVTSSSGSGASFKLYVSGGEIRKIDILSGGSGYDDRDLTLEVTGGGGTGCVLEPVMNSSGTITDVIIRNPGVGYDTFKVILYYQNGGVVKTEIIEYTYVNSNNIDGCTRGVGGTTATSHDAQIESPTDDTSTYTLVYFENHQDYL